MTYFPSTPPFCSLYRPLFTGYTALKAMRITWTFYQGHFYD